MAFKGTIIDGYPQYKHPLYIRYRMMIARCYHENNDSYKWYGERGIKVCDRWLGKDGFQNYVKDIKQLGPRPSPKHTLDRIQNDGNYMPHNMQWATPQQQVSNQGMRKTNTSGYRGVSYYARKKKWTAEITHNSKRIFLGYFTSPEAAAKAYDIAAIQYRGPRAFTNFRYK